MTKYKENEYKFVKYFNYDDDITEGEARQQAMYVSLLSFLFKPKEFLFFSTECQEDKCDYLFVIDSIAHIDNPDTLIELIARNRTIVSPMLLRPEKTWSNFWGDITDEGFYKRSPDYLDIIGYNKV
jgi:procollagen-lysine,2-oxoglutarate 5-dioxygenase